MLVSAPADVQVMEVFGDLEKAFKHGRLCYTNFNVLICVVAANKDMHMMEHGKSTLVSVSDPVYCCINGLLCELCHKSVMNIV